MNYGESAYILCSIISGDLPVQIQWFFNNKPIHEMEYFDRVHIANFGQKAKALSIDSVDEHFIGNYSCKATNLAENAYYTAELLVNGILKHFYESFHKLSRIILFYSFRCLNINGFG